MSYSSKGLFIVVDGPDGSGKSTLAEAIREYIHKDYRHLQCVMTCEKMGTSLGRLCTEVMHGEWHDKRKLAAKTKWMLYEASRMQNTFENVLPELEQKHVVIQDRYIESTIAYQSVDCQIDYKTVAKVTHATSGDLVPDITFITDCDLSTLEGRLAKRNKLSYFEAKGADFLRRVRAVYMDRVEEHRLSWNYNLNRVDTEVEKGTAIKQCTRLIDHWIANKYRTEALLAH